VHESNMPHAVHSRAPYHRIGLLGLVPTGGYDPPLSGL
jgi:hypothetical protein